MKIGYITAVAPYGPKETFVLREAETLRDLGQEVRLFPIRPQTGEKGTTLPAMYCRAHGIACYRRALAMVFTHPLRCTRAVGPMLFQAGGFVKMLKNLYFVPKGLATAWYLWKHPVDFLHAHWLATPATVGYIASAVTGIPLGLTGHRYDVYENNAIACKAARARFVRLIDENGYRHVLSLVRPEDRGKVCKLYLGAPLPEDTTLAHPEISGQGDRPGGEPFSFCVPANLVEIKGHRYLIEALRRMGEKAAAFRCFCYGEGECRPELERLVREGGLEAVVSFPGYRPNERLMEDYRNGRFQAVVLPSVALSATEHEGIPVCLMETMAWGMPVIATRTGGIPELLADGSGLLVPDKDPDALADALLRLKDDPALRWETGEKGRRRVREAFDNRRNTEALLRLIIESSETAKEWEKQGGAV